MLETQEWVLENIASAERTEAKSRELKRAQDSRDLKNTRGNSRKLEKTRDGLSKLVTAGKESKTLEDTSGHSKALEETHDSLRRLAET